MMPTKLFAALLLLVVLPSRADDVFLGGVVSGGKVVGEHSDSYVDVTGYAGLGLWVMLGAERKEFRGQPGSEHRLP